jgi:hypothetical protein
MVKAREIDLLPLDALQETILDKQYLDFYHDCDIIFLDDSVPINTACYI